MTAAVPASLHAGRAALMPAAACTGRSRPDRRLRAPGAAATGAASPGAALL